MTYSNNWLNFRKSEDKYFTCRYNVMQDKEVLANDLGAALQSADNRETALRLLAEMTPEFTVVAPLLSLLVDAAVDSSNLTAISLARKVLYNYRNELQTRRHITAVANSYLAGNDEWHYRRVAELYELLGYNAELEDLLLRCRESSFTEIREISEDADSMI